MAILPPPILKLWAKCAATLVLCASFLIMSSCATTDVSHPIDAQVFRCPPEGCDVSTDAITMAIIVLRQTDTPGENGIFNSDTRLAAYREAVDAGKILTIFDGTLGKRTYQTPIDPATPVRYSVVKILDGQYSGRAVVVQDKYLR